MFSKIWTKTSIPDFSAQIERLKTAIDDVVDSVTLAQLVEWQQQKNDNYII